MDRGQILDTIRGNFEANRQLCGECVVQVEEIDFFKPISWRRKLSREIAQCNLILAADVVYNEEITSSFFNALSDLIEDNQSNDVRVLIGWFHHLVHSINSERARTCHFHLHCSD